MWRPPFRLVVAVVVLTATSLPSAAELVVFSGGHVLKVAGFEVIGEGVVLRLPSGGGMRVSLSSVERIVDDEVEAPVEGPDGETGGAPIRLGFDDGQPVPDTPYGDLIFVAARREEINPALVAAMVRAESAFDPGAVSVKGARGLMQLMPATARRFGVPTGDLFNPERNLEAGTRYLSWLVKKFPDDLPRILAAYNAGEANVARYGGVPPFRETRGYIKRIYGTLGLDAVR
ncbi:MAG: lytic transglycosylase domain-containing protein [bacterium]|nr:lytic transglycosylase domain-containing protein [bacterium]